MRYLGMSENAANAYPLDTTVIPVVEDATARDEAFPDPEDNQRVQNLGTGTIQRWDGATWVTDYINSAAVSTACSSVQSVAISAATSAAGA